MGSRLVLSRFVEHVHVLGPTPGRARRIDRLPDGRTTLVVRELDGGRTGDVTVSGPRTRAHFKDASGIARVVVLQIKPGWSASLLGVAAHALTDRVVLLEDIWGQPGRELAVELLASPHVADVLDRLSRSFALRAGETFEPASARLARRAAHLLEGGEVRVDRVAAQLGVTPRHLRRAFTEHVGIGPKDFARIVRLQRALRMVTAASGVGRDWRRIALDAGYYDQAHLIGDFRELVGLTPGAYSRRAG